MTGFDFSQANFSILHSPAKYPGAGGGTATTTTRNSMNMTQQQFPAFLPSAKPPAAAQTSYGARSSLKQLEMIAGNQQDHNHESIRDDMS